jgi:putative FmdB family regulatory protein
VANEQWATPLLVCRLPFRFYPRLRQLQSMPLFEYRCDDCRQVNTLLVYSWSKETDNSCRRCGGSSLTKLVSRFTVRRSWGDSLNWAPGGEALTDVDEDDPHSVDRFMGRIKDEMGGEVTSDFEEMRRELLSSPDDSDHGHPHDH